MLDDLDLNSLQPFFPEQCRLVDEPEQTDYKLPADISLDMKELPRQVLARAQEHLKERRETNASGPWCGDAPTLHTCPVGSRYRVPTEVSARIGIGTYPTSSILREPYLPNRVRRFQKMLEYREMRKIALSPRLFWWHAIIEK